MIGEPVLAARIMRRWVSSGLLVALGCGELYDIYSTSNIFILVVTFAYNVFNNLSCAIILCIQPAMSLSRNMK